jgi:DNA-binding MarR family transcriptional regulator
METDSVTDQRALPSAEGPPGGSAVLLLSSLGFVASRAFAEALRAVDLDPRQFAVLNVTALSEGRSQQAIAGDVGVPPSRLVAIVDEFEARGLVERRRNPEDRRAYALYLTADGWTVLEKARRLSRANEERFCEPLEPAEREQLLELLRRLAAGQNLGAAIHPGLAEPD